MISKDLQVKIRRLHDVEKWNIGAIATHLGVHRVTVYRYLSKPPNYVRTRRCQEFGKRKTDNFISFIEEQLEKYPKITASRLQQMLVERGYTGSIALLRHVIMNIKGKKCSEAYLHLKTLPGEQAQVDWAHFGNMQCGNTTRPLMAFVITLSHSRAIYLHYCLSHSLSNFLHGHELAFNWFGGVPRVCLYDNLKSVVIERIGQNIRFNEQFLNFVEHYRFEPKPVGVARGNEKGRVERAIRYIRDNFFTARNFKDLTDLNLQALAWCNENSLNRKWTEDDRFTVGDMFAKEKDLLLALPDNPYPCEERHEVSIAKTPYARFDLNNYSVPHEYVRKNLTVFASAEQVRIVDGTNVVATHSRSYEKNKQIEDPTHIQRLVEHKVAASLHSGIRYLYNIAPISEQLLQMIAERGLPLRSIKTELMNLLCNYGVEEFEIACKEAIEHQSPHPHSVRHILERNRQQVGKTIPNSIQITDDNRANSIIVTQHKLDTYDNLLTDNSKDNTNDNN